MSATSSVSAASRFGTKTDELSLRAESVTLLTKSLQPLPEKWHGLTDVETRYRQRYLDLIVNPEVGDVFKKRSQIISLMRAFMQERDYLEVETPMMQPVAGGATAKPFCHPSQYPEKWICSCGLRRSFISSALSSAVFERVFEINRNFRNEGISIQHNPEFTMMEFYQAYATYHDLMDMTEEMIGSIAEKVCGSRVVSYGGKDVDLTRTLGSSHRQGKPLSNMAISAWKTSTIRTRHWPTPIPSDLSLMEPLVTASC